MFFADSQALQKETIICYVDYKAWRSSPAHSAVYIMLVSALAYITNSIGHVSYPSLLFNCVPFLFAGGILCGLLAHVMFTLKNTYVWADSVKMFRCQYSPGMLVQDASILCLHASLCVSFYARCKAGNCDNEQIPFCNPEEPLDAFPFGHAHFLLMLPLLTRALVNNASFGGTVACWGMMLCALAVSMVRFSLSRGSHFYVGHAGLVLFAIYVIESLNYERYQLCQRTGVSPAEEAHLDSPALTRSNSMPKLIKTGSFSTVQTPVGHICPRPLLGVPYVFVSDLLAPTRFMRDSTKSLMQLMAALVKISASDEDTRKDASTKQVQINAVVKKMDMVLNQAFVCSSLVSMQMNLAGDAIKHDLEDEIRPKSQSVNVSSVLMDCVLIGRTMQKVVSLNVLSVPKNDLIANVLGDTDWIMESLLCMICNSIRMSSPNGTVHIIIEIKDQPIPSKDFNEKVRIDEMEQGRAKSSKVLQFIVDTDGGTAVKNGMTHPVEILGAWVDFMNKEADSRLNLTRNSSSRSNIFSDKVVSASVKSGAINTLSPGGILLCYVFYRLFTNLMCFCFVLI